MYVTIYTGTQICTMVPSVYLYVFIYIFFGAQQNIVIDTCLVYLKVIVFIFIILFYIYFYVCIMWLFLLFIYFCTLYGVYYLLVRKFVQPILDSLSFVSASSSYLNLVRVLNLNRRRLDFTWITRHIVRRATS